MICIIEDDPNILEIETYALQSNNYEVCGYKDPLEFLKQLPECKLIVVDMMLPNLDGLQVIKEIRKMSCYQDTGIIVVSAKSQEMDKVKALNMGADDYLIKPFGIMELLARVKAILRRMQPKEKLQYANLQIDDEKHLVYYQDEEVSLTFKEYELLKYLLINAGLAVSRESLLNQVWGNDVYVETRTIDMHIKSLRKKLADDGTLIKTIRNVGYKLGG